MIAIDQDQIEALDVLFHKVIQGVFQKVITTDDERLKDVSMLDLTIISAVARKPDLILKDIRVMVNLPNTTLTSLIDRLEKRKLLKRVISTRDRRSYGLELMARGKMLYQAHMEYEQKLFHNILGMLDTQEERATFIQLSQKIIAGLKAQ
jgi:DNA-binding MarR family transcriptional regulator